MHAKSIVRMVRGNCLYGAYSIEYVTVRSQYKKANTHARVKQLTEVALNAELEHHFANEPHPIIKVAKQEKSSKNFEL